MDKLVELLKKSAKLWQTFDLILDKIYLENQNIKVQKENLQGVSGKILKVDTDIIKSINEVYICLD